VSPSAVSETVSETPDATVVGEEPMASARRTVGGRSPNAQDVPSFGGDPASLRRSTALAVDFDPKIPDRVGRHVPCEERAEN
jgi:hypothetical protein